MRRVSLVAPFALVLLVASGCAPERPPNVLFIVIDTLRADFLPSYGHPRPSAPHIESLAREGVVFERVVAPSSWTKTSMASIVTSQGPLRHGVRTVWDALPRAPMTIAEGFRRLGYRTLGVNTNPWLTPKFAFDEGFDVYETVMLADGERVSETALEILAEESGAPTFLYVHYFDPHAPYAPEPEFFASPPLELPGRGKIGDRELERAYRTRRLTAPAVEERVRALYEAEIRQTDAAVGALLDGLRRRGFLDAAVLALTSDHGEAFLEHDETQHGWGLYPELNDVPLVFWGPGLVPRGTRVEALVSSIDIAPTLFALAGLEAPPSFEGRPLLPMERGALEDGVALSAVGLNDVVPDRDLVSVTSSRFLYIREKRSDRVEFYDLEQDPLALRDLGRDHPEVAAHAALEGKEVAVWPRRGVQIDARTREQLEAIGYLQGDRPAGP